MELRFLLTSRYFWNRPVAYITAPPRTSERPDGLQRPNEGPVEAPGARQSDDLPIPSPPPPPPLSYPGPRTLLPAPACSLPAFLATGFSVISLHYQKPRPFYGVGKLPPGGRVSLSAVPECPR